MPGDYTASGAKCRLKNFRELRLKVLLRKRTGRIEKPTFWYALSDKCFGLA